MKRRAAPSTYKRRVKRRIMRRFTRRIPRAIQSRIPMLRISRTRWHENWSPDTVTTNGFWRYYTTSLNSIQNNTEFTNLFDQYRIAALKYVFRPRYDSFAGNDTTDTTLPGVTNQGRCMLHVVNDPYSTVTPSGAYNSGTLNGFFEQGNSVKTYSGNRPVTVYFRPTVLANIGGQNSQVKRAPFLNVTDVAASHRGFHIFAQDVNMTGVFGQSWDVYITYYLTLKNQR